MRTRRAELSFGAAPGIANHQGTRRARQGRRAHAEPIPHQSEHFAHGQGRPAGIEQADLTPWPSMRRVAGRRGADDGQRRQLELPRLGAVEIFIPGGGAPLAAQLFAGVARLRVRRQAQRRQAEGGAFMRIRVAHLRRCQAYHGTHPAGAGQCRQQLGTADAALYAGGVDEQRPLVDLRGHAAYGFCQRQAEAGAVQGGERLDGLQLPVAQALVPAPQAHGAGRAEAGQAGVGGQAVAHLAALGQGCRRTPRQGALAAAGRAGEQHARMTFEQLEQGGCTGSVGRHRLRHGVP